MNLICIILNPDCEENFTTILETYIRKSPEIKTVKSWIHDYEEEFNFFIIKK
jgi:hypothetical protein